MARSWNWHMWEITGEHAAYVLRQFNADDPYRRYSGQCRTPGCGKMAECYVSYDYITGAKGRTSTAQKQYCRPHAEEVMARHAQAAAS